jgi:IclR family transcriptional regulator, acetate operon repressor
MTDGPAYPIESVDRALTLILMLQESDSIKVSEAGRLLGVSRSTAFRLLSLLQHRQFVIQNPRSKAFHAGPALLRVGLAAVYRSDLRSSIRPLIQAVVAEVDETAHLVVLQGAEGFFLDCVEGSKMIRATPRVGTALPAHVTAGGKVLLAALDPDQVKELLPAKLPAVTSQSKLSRAAVLTELKEVRSLGWALNDGESEDLLRAVAVLVPGSPERGGVDAAVTVAGPRERMNDKRIEVIVEALQQNLDRFLAAEQPLTS